MYSFDPVGSYERETYRAGGSGGNILQPLLDNQVNVGRNSTGSRPVEAWGKLGVPSFPDDHRRLGKTEQIFHCLKNVACA